MMSREFAIPDLLSFSYLGEDFSAGPRPTLIYFSLSDKESLELAPYNSPATLFQGKSHRTLSFTLPGHGPGYDKHKAMSYWGDEIDKASYLLENFIDKAALSIGWLIDRGLIDPKHVAICGLSRGAFIATHIAAKEKRIPVVLGFAPLTAITEADSYKVYKENVRFQSACEKLNLISLTEDLTHLKHLRFYIGNHDTCVSTDACYSFIRLLSHKVHEKRARHCQIELRIYHAIGHQGHGTPPHIFEEGIEWLQKQIS